MEDNKPVYGNRQIRISYKTFKMLSDFCTDKGLKKNMIADKLLQYTLERRRVVVKILFNDINEQEDRKG